MRTDTHGNRYGTPDGFRMMHKIARGCYRVMEWRGECWMPIARDLSYRSAQELVREAA